MAKGFRLKELLKHEKEQQKLDKLEESSKSKTAEELAKEDITIVNHDKLLEQEEAKKAQAIAKAKADRDAAASVKGDDYKSGALSKKEKRQLKKQQKKQNTVEENDDEEEEEEEEEETTTKGLDLDRLQESDSESEIEEEEEEKEEEDDVPLSDVEFDSDADIVPYSKLTINNVKAMKHCLERVALPWAKHSFQEHQSVISKENTDSSIKDIYDDTERELAFYKQSLEAVNEGYEKLHKKLRIPFIRPLDYFAEMVKNDEHMDKIKSKLVTEVSEKKARDEARRQRHLKKFGKQVQHATLQKRQLEKKDTLDKIKNLKKKRKSNEIGGAEFDVGISEEVGGDYQAAGDNKNDRWSYHKPSAKRESKNGKYGNGGMKRFKRKNDADSSADVSGFSQKKMKSGRPGKSRRQRRY
ncbi:rRNA-processing protein Ebp2p [Monosporozyma servazzii]